MDATKKSREESFTKRLEAFKLKMKRLQMSHALVAAKRTLELMRELLAMHKHDDPTYLIAHIKDVGRQMIEARPQELVVANMVRRVLHLVREIAASEGSVVTATSNDDAADVQALGRSPAVHPRPISLLTLLDNRAASVTKRPSETDPTVTETGEGQAAFPAPPPSTTAASRALGDDGSPTRSNAGRSSFEQLRKKKMKNWLGKPKVLEVLNELIDEMDLAEEAIVASALQHIHSNEVIMTFGLSQTTLKFLMRAAERRTFQVIVAEAAPRLQGLTMAKQLTDAGISTLVIPDAAIFALMARVNKVLVGAQAVLGTGGVLAQAGSALVAQAAKHYRVPFIVVTGLYKLSPMFPHDPQVTFSNHGCPSSFANHKLKSHTLREENGKYVEADLLLPCPSVDYVEPGLIDLLITDTGGYTPSYVYRLLSEYYSREDYVLAKSMMDGMIGAGH